MIQLRRRVPQARLDGSGRGAYVVVLARSAQGALRGLQGHMAELMSSSRVRLRRHPWAPSPGPTDMIRSLRLAAIFRT